MISILKRKINRYGELPDSNPPARIVFASGKLRHLLALVAAAGLFTALGVTAFAGNLPKITTKTNIITIDNNNPSSSVTFNVDNWRSTSAYKVNVAVMDTSIASAELDTQNAYDFKIRVKSKKTGNTVVKVWLDGFSRTGVYIAVNSMVYSKQTIEGITVGDYGYMTGTLGECATLEKFVIDKSSSSPVLWVYFDLKEKGMGDGRSATFQVECKEADGDSLGIINSTATGMTAGGTGYKMAFRLPAGTASVKVENMDF